jgi:hypothetical protein
LEPSLFVSLFHPDLLYSPLDHNLKHKFEVICCLQGCGTKGECFVGHLIPINQHSLFSSRLDSNARAFKSGIEDFVRHGHVPLICRKNKSDWHEKIAKQVAEFNDSLERASASDSADALSDSPPSSVAALALPACPIPLSTRTRAMCLADNY